MRPCALAFCTIVATAGTAMTAGPSIYPTSVTIYDPARAYNSYVLFDGRDQKSYLIDMNGHDVHSWSYSGFPVEMIDPAINRGRRGHVIVQKEPNSYQNETLLELEDGRDLPIGLRVQAFIGGVN